MSHTHSNHIFVLGQLTNHIDWCNKCKFTLLVHLHCELDQSRIQKIWIKSGWNFIHILADFCFRVSSGTFDGSFCTKYGTNRANNKKVISKKPPHTLVSQTLILVALTYFRLIILVLEKWSYLDKQISCFRESPSFTWQGGAVIWLGGALIFLICWLGGRWFFPLLRSKFTRFLL